MGSGIGLPQGSSLEAQNAILSGTGVFEVQGFAVSGSQMFQEDPIERQPG